MYAWDGGKLERLIAECGLTDQEVADWVGVSLKTIFNWRRNLSEPPGRHVPSLEDLLHVERGGFYAVVPREGLSSTAPRSGATAKRST